jgi:hypothetical protein
MPERDEKIFYLNCAGLALMFRKIDALSRFHHRHQKPEEQDEWKINFILPSHTHANGPDPP